MGKMNNEVERKMFILLVANEKIKKTDEPKGSSVFLAEKEGFEPSNRF